MSKAKVRDTYNYELRSGHKTVYRGVTNNLERRMREHRRDGKKFTHATIIGNKKTREGALKMERNLIKNYSGNNGKGIKYNKMYNK